MAFEILTQDCLRKNVEYATNGEATVLYDAYGFPSFMAVIPKMTIGDIFDSGFAGYAGLTFSDWANNTHPAFIIVDPEDEENTLEVPEIFISMYNNTFHDDIPLSVPGEVSDHIRFESTHSNLRTITSNKGTGWHLMNVWEYSLLQMWSSRQGYEIDGDDGVGMVDTPREDPRVFPDETNISSTGKFFISKKLDELSGTFIVGEEVYIIELDYGDPDDYTTLPPCVGRGLLESFEFWNFLDEDIPTHGLLTISDIFGTFIRNAYLVGSKSGAWFQIGDIFSMPREGMSKNTWRHNHSFSGVWGLNNYVHLIDGISLINNIESNDLGGDYYNKQKIFKYIPNNYLDWNQTWWDGLSLSEAAFHSSRSGTPGNYNYTITLDKANIDSSTICVFPPRFPVSMTFSTGVNYSSISLNERRYLAMMGFPALDFTILGTFISDNARLRLFNNDDDDFPEFFLTKNFRRTFYNDPNPPEYALETEHNMWNNQFYPKQNTGEVRPQTFRTSCILPQ